MSIGTWRTDINGHAYYIYTKTTTNVSMNHDYLRLLCSDAWAGNCKFQDF